MDTLANASRALQRLGGRLGPYLLLEVLLPGGTLLALLLFLYRRRPLMAIAPSAPGDHRRWSACAGNPPGGVRRRSLLYQE